METMHKKDTMKTAPHKDDCEGKDGSSTDEWDPWNPPCPPRALHPPVDDMTVHMRLAEEWKAITRVILAKSRATNIIIPDRTPQWVNDALFDTLPRLTPILKKDSFLSLFDQDGQGMVWGCVITPETFNQIIVHNALQCAKVALKGQALQLNGIRANPNYMTQYGYFLEGITEDKCPLHLCEKNNTLLSLPSPSFPPPQSLFLKSFSLPTLHPLPTKNPSTFLLIFSLTGVPLLRQLKASRVLYAHGLASMRNKQPEFSRSYVALPDGDVVLVGASRVLWSVDTLIVLPEYQDH